MRLWINVLLVGFLATTCSTSTTEDDLTWAILPFEKVDEKNPVFLPDSQSLFFCPVREDTVHWEAKDVFNPATVVKDGKVHLIYRAEDFVGKHNGTSRLGLAISENGLDFERTGPPVFYPERDSFQYLEWEGGVEDPRIVEREDGLYFMTYTAYDGETARLLVASSPDLKNWQKYGSAFSSKYANLWSKSGSIVCEVVDDRLVAKKIKDKYWMYFGDKNIHLASSMDLIHWEPLEDEAGELSIILNYRPGYFDSDLVEPGPPAIMYKGEILLIYNGRNYGAERHPDIPEGTYSAGQALFSHEDPSLLLKRTENPFFIPDKDYEIQGQVNRVVFLEALAPFNGEWLLYYGTADSKIAVAKCPR
jgi:predicted GH43/DUF377 family glycosyl hydrolase